MFQAELKTEITIDKGIETRVVKAKDLDSDTWIVVNRVEVPTDKTAEQIKAEIQAKADEEKARYVGSAKSKQPTY